MRSSGVAPAYGRWLWLLAALFVARVIAQPLALLIDRPFLPPFDAWHSGVVPYGVLVATQVAIVAVMCRAAWRMSRSRVAPDRRFGVLMLAAGGVYLVIMLLRLVLGATALSEQPWFARPLPTAFHLVLAGFMLVYGYFHSHYGSHS